MSEPVRFRDIVVVGGGCYGTFYTGQLLRARSRRVAEWERLVVVDRNADCQAAAIAAGEADVELRVEAWDAFFDGYLGSAVPGPDAIVPSPLMPHLMFDWLVRAARRRWPRRAVTRRRAEPAAGTPYDRLHPDGTRYVSFADWLCPVHCVEPATCPVTAAPRTWEMSDAVTELTERLARQGPVAGPVLFVCRHRAYGVGMFDVSEVLAGDATIAAAGADGSEVDVVVGTVSSCHGAVSLLHLGLDASSRSPGGSPYISECV